MEAILRQATDDTVIADEAVFAEQQAIAAAPDTKLRPWIGVHAVHEFRRIRADNFDLAERGGIEHAERLAGRLAFTRHGLMHVFAGFREIPCAPPQRHRLESRAMLFGPAIDWRLARDIKQFATIVAAERAEGGRRIGRTEGGETHLRRRALERIGCNGQTIDVGRLALIGRHAVGGIALDVLDGVEALAHGQTNILGGHIVLEIDESLGLARIAIGRQFATAYAVADEITGHSIV